MSYAEFVQFRQEEKDNNFSIRVLSGFVTAAVKSDDPRKFHEYPGSTGEPMWDRVIRGAAMITGGSRCPEVLEWAAPKDTFPIFDPLETLPQWVFPTYMNTPIQLREQGVLLDKYSLTTARCLKIEPKLEDYMEFDNDQIIGLLKELDRRLGIRGASAEIYIVGGAAMSLEYSPRRMTEDIDVFYVNPVVDEIVAEMADEMDLPAHWLSRGIMDLGYDPDRDPSPRSLDVGEHTQITVASPEFLLALKATAHRSKDLEDAVTLCATLNLTQAHKMEELIRKYIDTSGDGGIDLFLDQVEDSL